MHRDARVLFSHADGFSYGFFWAGFCLNIVMIGHGEASPTVLASFWALEQLEDAALLVVVLVCHVLTPEPKIYVYNFLSFSLPPLSLLSGRHPGCEADFRSQRLHHTVSKPEPQ